MTYLSVIQVTLLIAIPGLTNGFVNLGVNLNHLLEGLDDGKFDFRDAEEKSIEQPLDHFDTKENRTYKMRYFQNLDLWKANGPVYLFLCGESKCDPGFITYIDNLLIGQLAKETNGALFATEHRYYGQSSPDIPDDDKIEYYKFLNARQALADNANFIKFLKADSKYKSSKLVVVGGSYSGNLAAWIRELYPELVDAAVASSAPVLAKKDFQEYLDITRYTFDKYGGPNCLKNIETKFKRYEELLKTTNGIETLKKEQNICSWSNMTILENQQLLFDMLYGDLKFNAQYKNPDVIKEVCSMYGKKSMPDHLNLFKQMASDDTCVDINFSSAIDQLPWTYQYCNEFGYLQTTTSEKQPFVHWNPLEFELKFCERVVKGDIEKNMDEGVARTNKMYGGLTLNVTKVVFTHGDMDPWHALGVQHDLSPDAPATVVNGTSHCAILIIRKNEPKELTEKREYVTTLIKKWIGL